MAAGSRGKERKEARTKGNRLYKRVRRMGAPNLLREARVYLSGPMDFVASRADERKEGWRNRVGDFLRKLDVTVFDPWVKPDVRGFHEYGREDDKTSSDRDKWKWQSREQGAAARAKRSEKFWPSMHIDLRMVDTCDFVVAYCPTNIYSVGTPHEIIVARQQRKPVLLVSPHVYFPSFDQLKNHLQSRRDVEGARLLHALKAEVPIRANTKAIPSSWYMPLIGGEHFFDGFGFAKYKELFRWREMSLDDHEERYPPQKPLLPFLERLNDRLPKKWGLASHRFVRNDDWLLWDLKRVGRNGAEWRGVN